MVFQSSLQAKVFLATCLDRLKLKASEQGQWNIFENVVFIQVCAKPPFVLEQDTVVILVRTISEIQIDEAGQHDQQDEESAREHLDLVVFLQQELRHGDSDIVAAGAVGVAILLEIVPSGVVGENLRN